MAAALVVFVPLEVASTATEPANDLFAHRTLYLALQVGISGVATPWAYGAIVKYLAEGGSALGAYGKLEGAIRGLVFGGLLAGIGILIGLVLLIVPGLIIASRWCLLAPAVVLEHHGATDGLRRSNTIVKGATGRVLAVLAVVFLTGLAVVFVVSAVGELVAPGFVASLVFGLSFDLVVVSLLATTSYVLYRALAPTEASEAAAQVAAAVATRTAEN